MKVYKITLMVIDDDEVGGSAITSVIQNAHYPNRCISPSVVEIEERDIGEWSDDHPLNKHARWRAEFNRLFGS